MAGHTMSDFGDSPDPQIVQLQAILRRLFEDERAKKPANLHALLELDLAYRLASRLIEQYPVLTERA
jgi:hypothetical protein